MSDEGIVDYHYTPTEMDLAREMKDFGLEWPYGIGDCFCTEEDQMFVAINIVKEDSTTWIEATKQKQRFSLKDIVWLPKRTQAIQWLKERRWRIQFKPQGNNCVLEALGGDGGASGSDTNPLGARRLARSTLAGRERARRVSGSPVRRTKARSRSPGQRVGSRENRGDAGGSSSR